MSAQLRTATPQRRWNDVGQSTGAQMDDMEKRLRMALVADAAGMSDWEDERAEQTPPPQKPNQTVMSASNPALVHTLNLARIAVDVLSPHTSKTLAIIGSGPEAEAHMAAALDRRSFTEVRIYARQPVAASGLAKKFRDNVPKPIEVCGAPEQAVHNADVVILATGDTKPVIDADWLMQGVHVSCAFPQEMRNNEIPTMLLNRAKIIASDSPQKIGDNKQHLMSGLKTRRGVIHLGAMIDRFNPDRQRGITLFFDSCAR